jgi:phosphoglycolate phosphatase-like HAD superfamily hydrolase
MAATRGGLARLAIERARSEGRIAPSARISLIGDARQDIEAALENGIQAIAVRTGITPVEELEAAQPDLLLEDLTQLDPRIL